MTDLPIVIGTAGHVDHGKTTLIRALTGVDTDRLAEEKRRGLTIDLGFAPFELPSGRVASVVDVPGHEKFLKNMLAGAPGMDLVLLVVAADDGVMPQTREHLEILSLLAAQKGVVVVTKTDLVDPELLELAQADIREALAGTFLENAPLIPVSAPTGAGLEALRAALDEVATQTRARDATAAFRLPIDRVFVKQGFGTVVTGTLVTGTLREGDPIAVLPEGMTTRARGLQVHGGKRDRAVAGQRVAINLVGLERAELGRGDWLVAPGRFVPSRIVDVWLELLPHVKALEHRSRIRLHHGTAELIGRVRLLDRDRLEPGAGAYAQLMLEGPVVADFHDRFILRRYAPLETLGGGGVVAPVSRRLRRHQSAVLEALDHARAGRWSELAAARLREAGGHGLTRGELEAMLPSGQGGVVDALLASAVASRRHDRLIHRDARDHQEARVLSALAEHARTHPHRVGMPREALQASLQIPLKALSVLLEGLEAAQEVRHVGRLFALCDREARLTAEQARAREAIASRLSEGRFVSEADVLAGLPVPVAKDLLDDAIEAGCGVRLGQGILASRDALAEARRLLDAHFDAEGALSASQARELLGTNRKAVIPLLEYLDTQGYTRRQGDVRLRAARC